MYKLILLGLFATALNPIFAKKRVEKETAVLINTELAFSAMSVEKGMAAAFIAFADKDVVKLSDGRFPIVGKEALEASFKDAPAGFTLSWYPLKAEVSRSADLGYTYGNWELTTANGEKRYGNYMSVWKKQDDGSWKFVLDGGNTTPPPVK